MQAAAGLRELAVLCSEDGEGLINGESAQPSKSKDHGWSATKVLEAALDESQASIDTLRRQAAESRAIAETILSKAAKYGDTSALAEEDGDSATLEAEQDQAYADLCRATDALALRFGRNSSVADDLDAKVAEDRDFLELMCERVIVPLKNGSVNSVDALAALKGICESQNELKGTEVYTLTCEGAITSNVRADADMIHFSTPSRNSPSGRPTMIISGYKPLPRDRADLSAAVANTNVRVSTLEGSLEAMQAKFDRMEKRLKNRDNDGLTRIPKREEDAAGGKGRMCSGGDDGGCLIN